MRVAAAALLLAAPTVLAFFSGGFFDAPRLVAGIAAWLLFAAIAITDRRPLPQSTPGRLALRGLVGLACWTTASIAWAPVADAATADAERAWLYAGAFACAAVLLREPRLARAVEPALALGAALGDRLRARHAVAARRVPDRALRERRRPARAAAHVLERSRCAGCGGSGALTAARVGPEPASVDAGRRSLRSARQWCWRCSSPSRAGRSPRLWWAWCCSSCSLATAAPCRPW